MAPRNLREPFTTTHQIAWASFLDGLVGIRDESRISLFHGRLGKLFGAVSGRRGSVAGHYGAFFKAFSSRLGSSWPLLRPPARVWRLFGGGPCDESAGALGQTPQLSKIPPFQTGRARLLGGWLGENAPGPQGVSGSGFIDLILLIHSIERP